MVRASGASTTSLQQQSTPTHVSRRTCTEAQAVAGPNRRRRRRIRERALDLSLWPAVPRNRQLTAPVDASYAATAWLKQSVITTTKSWRRRGRLTLAVDWWLGGVYTATPEGNMNRAAAASAAWGVNVASPFDGAPTRVDTVSACHRPLVLLQRKRSSLTTLFPTCTSNPCMLNSHPEPEPHPEPEQSWCAAYLSYHQRG